MSLAMTNEEIRIKVAELCGWINVHEAGTREISEPLMDKGFGLVGFRLGQPAKQLEQIPNYPEDLNACHEFEKELTEEQWRGYIFALLNLMKLDIALDDYTLAQHFSFVHATARQRCEAFIKVMETC